MSQCIIKEHLGGGKYRVDVLYDTLPLNKRKIDLDAHIVDLAKRLITLNNAAQALYVDLLAARSEVDNQINIYNIIPPQNAVERAARIPFINKATINGLEVKKEYDQAETKYLLVKALHDSKVKERDDIIVNPPKDKEEKIIWCADLSDGVDGRAIYTNGAFSEIWCLDYDPDTMFLPPKNTILSVVPEIVDTKEGKFNLVRNMPKKDKAAMAFFNVATEPYMSVWKPLFVKGVITKTGTGGGSACSGSSGDATMDITVSALWHRHESSYYSDVFVRGESELIAPESMLRIEYFDGVSAFDSGDEVIIQVFDVLPNKEVVGRVIGFIDNPKEARGKNAPSCSLQLGNQTFYKAVSVLMPVVEVSNYNSFISGSINYNNAGDVDYGPEVIGYSFTESVGAHVITLENPDFDNSDPDCKWRVWLEQTGGIISVDQPTLESPTEERDDIKSAKAILHYGRVSIPYHEKTYYDSYSYKGDLILIDTFLNRLLGVHYSEGFIHYLEQVNTFYIKLGVGRVHRVITEVKRNCSGAEERIPNFEDDVVGDPVAFQSGRYLAEPRRQLVTPDFRAGGFTTMGTYVPEFYEGVFGFAKSASENTAPFNDINLWTPDLKYPGNSDVPW